MKSRSDRLKYKYRVVVVQTVSPTVFWELDYKNSNVLNVLTL